ncbi:MAG: hypothetical protein KF712_07815 [Akkermansiaceae bacterium]|nr:hypothetical protein [Akkermansiaceae bacterium]
MTTREEAAEQLRVIRTMMERATIFRALSGETALIGGAAALAAAWLSEGRQGWAWAGWWLFGAAMVLLFNAWQIFRASSSHAKPFWNTGLKLAIRGALPSIVAGGFLGLLFVRAKNEPAAACLWSLHYGLALLAIREFAPRSMVWLGWAFVIFGVTGLAGVAQVVESIAGLAPIKNGSRLMAIAFGGFHLIYGAVIVTTKGREESEA